MEISENAINNNVLRDIIEKYPQQTTRYGDYFDETYRVSKILRLVKVSFVKSTVHMHQLNRTVFVFYMVIFAYLHYKKISKKEISLKGNSTHFFFSIISDVCGVRMHKVQAGT